MFIVRYLLLIIFSILTSASTVAQKGDLKDKPNEVQQENWKKYNLPKAPILTPEQALKRFTIQEGFKVELVASEPLVNDPVAMTWDEKGRLFVVEMWTFMPDVDGTGESAPKGRVVVLEDLDHDGVMDRSHVFLDKLVLPRAISAVAGGILIGEPPNLWFCADTNEDNKCDKKQKVADYAVDGSVEHMENGLLTSIDNWIYNVRSVRKFQWNGEKITSKPTAWRGQWGISQDSYGRLYSADNSNPLRVDYYPYINSNRNIGYKSTIAISQSVHKDREIFSQRPNPGINRGYREGMLRSDGRIKQATAASGPTIYRGDKYPARFSENGFFTEPSGNLIGRIKLNQNGISVTGEHIIYDDSQWEKLDFLTSTDERFRPVNMYSGPDGYLYIVDMYRGILQHKEFLTTYLRKQIIERNLDNPIGLGRIYRLVPTNDTSSRALPNFSTYSENKLVSALLHNNGWHRDTAQRLLVHKNRLKSNSLSALREIIGGTNTFAAIHALWILHAHNKLDTHTAQIALMHPDAWVRIHAMRVAEELTANSVDTYKNRSTLSGLYFKYLNNENPMVKLQAHQSLGALNNNGQAYSNTIIKHFLKMYKPESDNPHFIDAAISSLNNLELAFIIQAKKSNYTLVDNGRKNLIKGLVKALYVKQKSDELITLLQSIPTKTKRDWIDSVLIIQLSTLTNNAEFPPISIPNKKSFFKAISSLSEVEHKMILDGFRWPGKVSSNPLDTLSTAQIQKIQHGETLYKRYCTNCHQYNGQGIDGIAPPLSESEWVNGSPEQLALIITHGISGPITVNGKSWNLLMPAHGKIDALQKNSLADLMSYIRSSWANKSGPIDFQDISTILDKHKNRSEPWTEKSIKALSIKTLVQ